MTGEAIAKENKRARPEQTLASEDRIFSVRPQTIFPKRCNDCDVSKVFVLIAYTIYIIGILSAGAHVAVRSLFPAEMNVPHVARNVWLSGITEGFTYENTYYCIPFTRSHTLRATCGTLPCNENKHLTPKNPNEYKKSDD